MRIICCGNRDRGDDAAGLMVADQLLDMGIEAEVCGSDPLELMERWKSADDVIVVDAMLTGAPAGTVRSFEAPLRANLSGAGSSSHGLGVGEAICLAEILGRLPRRLRVYGIEGKHFQVGAGVSHEVQQAAENLARQIAAETILVEAAVGAR